MNPGSFLSVAGGTGGSLVRINGNLFSLRNGSVINLNDTSSGFLISLSGGSILDVTGGLIEFIGTGNQINVKNTLSFSAASSVTIGSNQIRVRLINDASGGQISGLSNSIKGTGTGTITYPSGTEGALIEINGASAKLFVR